jgi:hypothetical protein
MLLYIVMNMTIARQRFGKHRLKAGMATKRSGNTIAGSIPAAANQCIASQRLHKYIFSWQRTE